MNEPSNPALFYKDLENVTRHHTEYAGFKAAILKAAAAAMDEVKDIRKRHTLN